MGALNIIIIILTIISIVCVVKCALYKRTNIGFILMVMTIIGMDVVSFRLSGVKSAKDAGNVLLPFYIFHSWQLFAALLMVTLIDRYKRFIIATIISAAACIYQTYLVICQYGGGRIFSFQKRVYFRKAWFVAVDSKFTGLTMSFRSYRLATALNVFIILTVLILCVSYTQRILRAQYYSLIGVLAVFGILEYLTYRFTLPVWIPGMFYNLISVLCLYFVMDFARNRLKEWSLDSFANDMNDGLILYDKHNDLIHINDMIRNTMDDSLVESFREKSILEDFIKSRSFGEHGVVSYEKDGKVLYYNVAIKELGGRGGMKIGTLYILHDFTAAMTRINEIEENNRELERINRMKSDFLSNMSHELHTPMNAVIGMTDIAMHEGSMDKVKEQLLLIRNSGMGLLNIINDILDFSKLESGKMDLVSEEFSPYDMFYDILGELISMKGDKVIDVSVVLDTPLPKKLVGDKNRISQMVMNLSSNAVKFTNEGSVKLVCRCDIISEGSALLSCNVIDTGIGIRQEDMDKLFVSFSQVDAGRSRAAEGTGLGLPIVRGIADVMGGDVEVSSKYGEGSEFKISVPLTVSVEETDDRSVPEEGETFVTVTLNGVKGEEGPFKPDFTAPDAKVLVVDDNEINLTIACGLMAPLKIYPDTAGGGQEAVDMVLSKDYDIVFMDHMMPGMDGVAATRMIRAGEGKNEKPVIIALSANNVPEAINLFMESGMNDFVPKPVDVRVLTETIEKWLPRELIVPKAEGEDEADAGPEIGIDIAYLDLEKAVRALGSPMLYEKIAEEYYRSGAGKYDSIMSAYENEQWDDYTIKIHALKSSSRQIGAMELGDMAEALEKAGKAGDIARIKADTGECMSSYKRLLEDLSVYYPDEEDDESDKPLIHGAELAGMLSELESACNDLDMDVMEEISDRLKGYSYDADTKVLITSLREAVSNLDTEECLNIISRLS